MTINSEQIQALKAAAEKSADNFKPAMVVDTKIILSLLAESDADKKRIAEQREYYEGVIADGSKRIAELEARTLTVKLPPKVDSSNVPFAAHAWNSCIDEVSKCLAAAGITLVVGE